MAQFHAAKRSGQGWGHTDFNDPAQALNNYWKDNDDHWSQVFLSAPVHAVLTRRLSFDLTPYLSFGQGWDALGATGGFLAPANIYFHADGTPVPAGQQMTPYFQANESRQVGATASLNYDLDRHNQLRLGYWYENNILNFALPTSVTMADGTNPSPNWAAYQAFVVNGATGKLAHSTIGIDSGYELHSLFLQDSAKYLNDRLTVMGGFKFVMTNYWDKVAIQSNHFVTGEISARNAGFEHSVWRFLPADQRQGRGHGAARHGEFRPDL
ncbi:hypothetical protein [Nguyenibacter sp. L1]|uniref:hypothetical protein n=1 Tax=Nguyenibacter sp. L1 TaxID=3049350 RepID=UPI002B49A89A|nr:hypothetical protein [Nguyenibacter sp. L1]WRH86872.1 hypothetical protein QN315_12785 [Nguyenibacter sp. L1]